MTEPPIANAATDSGTSASTDRAGGGDQKEPGRRRNIRLLIAGVLAIAIGGGALQAIIWNANADAQVSVSFSKVRRSTDLLREAAWHYRQFGQEMGPVALKADQVAGERASLAQVLANNGGMVAPEFVVSESARNGAAANRAAATLASVWYALAAGQHDPARQHARDFMANHRETGQAWATEWSAGVRGRVLADLIAGHWETASPQQLRRLALDPEAIYAEAADGTGSSQ